MAANSEPCPVIPTGWFPGLSDNRAAEPIEAKTMQGGGLLRIGIILLVLILALKKGK